MKSIAHRVSARPSVKAAPTVAARKSVVVCSYSSDAPSLDRILDDLAKAQAENEQLKQRVAEEGARAAQSWKDLYNGISLIRGIMPKDPTYRARLQARQQAAAGAPAAAPARGGDNAQVLAALAAEKQKVEKLIKDAAEAPKIIAQERAAKEAAERSIKQLQSKLEETTRRIELSGKELKQAEAGEKQAVNSLDAFEAANQLNETLKRQLTEQIARATEAKELAASKQRELTQAAAKLREQQRMMKKVSDDAALAIEKAKRARELVLEAIAANKELEKKRAAEASRVKTVQEQVNMKQAPATISASTEAFNQIMSEAKKIEDVKEALAKTLASNENLKKQVLAEGQRASRAAKEFATYATLAKEGPKLREQMQAERQAKFNAQRAYAQVITALEAEKQRVQEIISEAGPTLEVIQSERTARADAEKAVRQLEAKLADANRRLDAQVKAIAEAEAEAQKGPDAPTPEDVAALEKANALIATLTNQLRGEIARGHAAKDLAAAKYKELTQAQSKLKDEQGKMKMASKDTGRFFDQAKKDQEALQAALATKAELEKTIAAEAAKAAKAEEEASTLSKQAQQRGLKATPVAPVSSAPQGTVFDLPTDDAEVAAQLNRTLDTNKVLTKQVMDEGARAAKASRELAAAHTRMNEAEKLIPALKTEISSMKDALVALKRQLEEVVATKSQREREREAKLEARLLSTAEELKKSQQQVVVAQKAAAELRETFDVTKSRVSLLEREVAEKHLEVSRR